MPSAHPKSWYFVSKGYLTGLSQVDLMPFLKYSTPLTAQWEPIWRLIAKNSLQEKLKFIKLKNLKLVLLSNKNIHKVHQHNEFWYQFVLQTSPNNTSNLSPVQMSVMGTNTAGGILSCFLLKGRSSLTQHNCGQHTVTSHISNSTSSFTC